MARASEQIERAAPERVPNLAEILGQERALHVLRSAIASKRVHHAWVFHGAAGVGKETTARAFGAALLDPTTTVDLSGVPTPDPDSETQRLLRAGAHPDFHVITKELARFAADRAIRERKLITIPKEVVDEHLLKPAGRAPSMRAGGLCGKVFIIDEAELLNTATQNALLKTLEEPAAGSVIILVTSAVDRLLPTILSRCQRVAFQPLTRADMETWARRWAAEREERGEAGPSARAMEFAIDFAEGAAGRAVIALEGDLHEWAAELDPMLEGAARGSYPAGMGAAMARMVDEWAKGQVERSPQASKDAANKAGARLLLSLLAMRFRSRLREGADDPSAVEGALRGIDLLREAEAHLASNVHMGVALENLAARLGRRVQV